MTNPSNDQTALGLIVDAASGGGGGEGGGEEDQGSGDGGNSNRDVLSAPLVLSSPAPAPHSFPFPVSTSAMPDRVVGASATPVPDNAAPDYMVQMSVYMPIFTESLDASFIKCVHFFSFLRPSHHLLSSVCSRFSLLLTSHFGKTPTS